MTIDKQNGTVCFNEDSHVYWNVNDNEKYISVTTLIDRYAQPFDSEFWSGYKALEQLLPTEAWGMEKKSLLTTHKIDKELLTTYNISELDFNKAQQRILDEWDKTNRESCERGTKIHAKLEQSMYDMGANVTLKKFGVGGKFICDKGRTSLDLDNGVYPEYLISYMSDDKLLRLAGQIDLLAISGNQFWILDWKGLPLDTRIATKEGWTTMRDIQVGDEIFDKEGNITKVLHKSSIHNNPCYKITFDNSESIVADKDHKWLITFKNKSTKIPYTEKVMTTEELFYYIDSIKDNRNTYNIPKIMNAKPINMEERVLPIDPYVLGCWLGDGSKQCGVICNNSNNIWGEIKSRGYEIGQDISAEDRCEAHTVIGLYSVLKSLNLLNNKHIPDMYLRASYQQRLDLLRGLMDTDGYYHPKRKRFVMETDQEWQKDGMLMLLGSLGIKPSVFYNINKIGDKEYSGWDVCFSTTNLNPFLSRNQEIEYPKTNKNSFRNIISVEVIETIPTQCIEVDSPTHTYLFGETMIPTHNTNKEIKQKSGFNTQTKSTSKMLYPLNNLDDCNYLHYTLQLSTYAWMVQQLRPDLNLQELIIVHFDHNGKQTVYHLDYLKDEVEKMFKHYKKEVIKERQKAKYKRIEY